jgi:crotonobetainyl-CoA:carnitine CoA-transferase CaiB-like acyl-CoA transferase
VPALGQHTDAILRELGLNDSLIEEMRVAGAV